MFLHLSVCPQGEGSASVHAGIPHPPRDQAPPPGRRLLLRTVRILLECILVVDNIYQLQGKVMFSEVFVCPPGGGWGTSSSQGPSSRQRPNGQTFSDGRCSGRYASYWNSFFFFNVPDLDIDSPVIPKPAMTIPRYVASFPACFTEKNEMLFG